MTKSHSELVTVTILGCGTSTGVPLLQCPCAVCNSKDPRNSRLRASILVQTQGKTFLVDTATDLRQQALRENIQRIDAILFTHPHADHTSGLDEVRSFNFVQKERIPAYGNAWTEEDLNARYAYIFSPTAHLSGGGIPLIDFHLIDGKAESLNIQGVTIIPLFALHGDQEVLGFRFQGFAYLTDCSTVPESALKRMEGLEILVLDCLRIAKHGTHLNLSDALELIAQLKPKKAILTHLGHDFDYVDWTKTGSEAKLPESVTLAYDGLKISTGN